VFSRRRNSIPFHIADARGKVVIEYARLEDFDLLLERLAGGGPAGA
jgi:hypothetical protein